MAIVLMMMGLWGMSFFSSPQRAHQVIAVEDTPLAEPLLPDEEAEVIVEEDTCNEDSSQTSVIESKWLSRLSKRQIGLSCAIIDGVWGGSILVPMHFARYVMLTACRVRHIVLGRLIVNRTCSCLVGRVLKGWDM